MSTPLEIAVWPDAKKLKKIYVSAVIITIAAWICHIIGTIYWDEYSYMVTNLRGQTYASGWPVKLYWWGMYIGICGPVGMLIVYLMNDRKNPSLGISKDGLFINQQLIKQTLVGWGNIERIDKSVKDGNITLEVHFRDASKIIEAQQGMRKTFVKENLKDGKPLVIEGRFASDNFAALAERATHYLPSN